MALCHDAAINDTMNSYVLGSAMDTAASADTPTLASCCWKAFTSAASFLYETVKAGLPGTMTAVDDESLEKACSKVVGDMAIAQDKDLSTRLEMDQWQVLWDGTEMSKWRAKQVSVDEMGYQHRSLPGGVYNNNISSALQVSVIGNMESGAWHRGMEGSVPACVRNAANDLAWGAIADTRAACGRLPTTSLSTSTLLTRTSHPRQHRRPLSHHPPAPRSRDIITTLFLADHQPRPPRPPRRARPHLRAYQYHHHHGIPAVAQGTGPAQSIRPAGPSQSLCLGHHLCRACQIHRGTGQG